MLHRNFDNRFDKFQEALVLYRTSDSHRLASFKDALLFLNYRCPDCYRPGGCNVCCRHCPSRVATGIRPSKNGGPNPRSRHTLSAAAEVRYQVARKLDIKLSRVLWAAAQHPLVSVVSAPVVVTSLDTTTYAAPTSSSNLHYVAEHQHLVDDHDSLNLGLC